jgi:Ca2+/H+ antiporter, TMEM165/GDT1 family
MKNRFIVKFGKGVLIFAFGTFALGFIVMLLWNALVPDLFNAPSLTFWQAVGLLILSHILLRGWGRWRYSNGWRRERWRHRFEEKLASLAPEEREKFKQEWRRRCGWSPEPSQPEKEARTT